MVFCALGAVSLGFVAQLGFRSDGNDSIAAVASGIAIIFLLGVWIFGALSRASAYGRIVVAGEGSPAVGTGRVGGGVASLVVIATDQRIVAIPGRLFRKPKIAVSIPYSEILNFAGDFDSLSIQGREAKISITKCPPRQVEALTAALRKHQILETRD
jgi:hypothetical protein